MCVQVMARAAPADAPGEGPGPVTGAAPGVTAERLSALAEKREDAELEQRSLQVPQLPCSCVRGAWLCFSEAPHSAVSACSARSYDSIATMQSRFAVFWSALTLCT